MHGKRNANPLEKQFGCWYFRVKELQSVLPYRLPRYKVIVENCKTCASLVSPSNLTFATGFILTFLFFRIKATRPMTYQYLTVEIFEHAKTTGGYIDQKLFKTTGTYGFDSIVLANISMKVIGNYIEFVRPLLQPSCGFILVNRNGIQFGKLTDLLSKLVYDAIGKYIHQTRYRQIVVSEDQKHRNTAPRLQGPITRKSALETLQLKDSLLWKNCVVLRVNMLRNHFRRYEAKTLIHQIIW